MTSASASNRLISAVKLSERGWSATTATGSRLVRRAASVPRPSRDADLSGGNQMNATAATVLLVLIVAGIGVGSARADQAEPPKRIGAAFQTSPKLIIRPEELFPLTPPIRLG